MTHEHHHEHHEHGLGHHHHHHHAPTNLNAIFFFAIGLNLLFVVIEAVVGFTESSLSLLSDAGHNLSDVFSLLLVVVGFGLAKVRANKQFTYGYKKSTVLISLLNALILLVAVGAIIVESIHKFRSPTEVNGAAISWTAGVGIVINGLTAWLLMRGQKEDLNVRGAFLHMVADTLVSVGVVISGVIISFTGWTYIDPIVSLLIAVVILLSTWDLLRSSLRETLDGIPEGVDVDEIVHHLGEHSSVKGVHHIHIWAISTTENALTAHVVLDDMSKMQEAKHALKHEMAEHGIQHVTLEFEVEGEECSDPCCE